MEKSILEQAEDERIERIARRVAQLLHKGFDEILTTKQAALYLQVHETTVSQMASRGELPGRKVGRDWRFVRSELTDYVRHGRQA